MQIGEIGNLIEIDDPRDWVNQKVWHDLWGKLPEIRCGMPVDNETRNTPGFIHGNQRLTLLQTYDGNLQEIFTSHASIRLPGNLIKEWLYACLWLYSDITCLAGLSNPQGSRAALHWRIELNGSPDPAAFSSGTYHTTYDQKVIPVTEWRSQDLVCTIRSFAPQEGKRRIRGAFYAIQIHNLSAELLQGKVSLVLEGGLGGKIDPFWNAEKGWVEARGKSLYDHADAYLAMMPLAPQPLFNQVGEECSLTWEFNLPAGSTREFTGLIILGDTPEELAATLKDYNSSPSGGWEIATIQSAKARLGELNIADGQWWAEFLLNHSMRADYNVRVNGSGEMIWGAIGPEDTPPYTNREDLIRGMSVHQWIHPELFQKFILFTHKFMTPPPGIPFSENMQANIALPILAEMYYRATGDLKFFYQHPEIGLKIEELLGEVMHLKESNHWLFRGEEVSDGHTLKPYDFINNLQVWRAFTGASRLMKEVFQRPGQSETYATIAESVRQAIFETMTVEGEFGTQFAAGTDFKRPICFMDGEDNFGAMAPFLGFCDFNDLRWKNYCRQGLSPANPTYDPQTGGLLWWDDPNVGHALLAATAPSFSSRLAAALTRQEAQREMMRIRRLSDVDTTFYWYPTYDQPRSKPCHSMWMTASTSRIILNHYLGVDIDAPLRWMAFKPWCPWHEFTWNDFAFGAGRFSVGHIRGEVAHSSWVTNHTDGPWNISFGFYIPEDQTVAAILVNHLPYTGQIDQRTFLTETLLTLQITLQQNETVRVTVHLDKAEKGGK